MGVEEYKNGECVDRSTRVGQWLRYAAEETCWQWFGARHRPRSTPSYIWSYLQHCFQTTTSSGAGFWSVHWPRIADSLALRRCIAGSTELCSRWTLCGIARCARPDWNKRVYGSYLFFFKATTDLSILQARVQSSTTAPVKTQLVVGGPVCLIGFNSSSPERFVCSEFPSFLMIVMLGRVSSARPHCKISSLFFFIMWRFHWYDYLTGILGRDDKRLDKIYLFPQHIS